MSSALQTVLTIKPATTDLDVRLGFVVFVRGSLGAHGAALDDLFARLQAGLLRRRLTRYRVGGRTGWAPLPDSSVHPPTLAQFGFGGPTPGRWGLELAEPGDETGMARGSLWVQISDLPPVRDLERASHVRVLFPDDTPPATIAALSEWAINRLPLWWGAAGFVFHHTSGAMVTAHTRMAALAKRYWGVQIQDLTSLQWDAFRGMPAVNWLSLIGNEFAAARDVPLDPVAEPSPDLWVFARRGPCGIALAAGASPTQGDINAGDQLDAFVEVAQRLKPLLLEEHTPLSGPFSRPEVLGAWLRRFHAPQQWLECDISAGQP